MSNIKKDTSCIKNIRSFLFCIGELHQICILCFCVYEKCASASRVNTKTRRHEDTTFFYFLKNSSLHLCGKKYFSEWILHLISYFFSSCLKHPPFRGGLGGLPSCLLWVRLRTSRKLIDIKFF